MFETLIWSEFIKSQRIFDIFFLYSWLYSVWLNMDYLILKTKTLSSFLAKVVFHLILSCFSSYTKHSLNHEQYNSLTAQAAVLVAPILWSNVGGWEKKKKVDQSKCENGHTTKYQNVCYGYRGALLYYRPNVVQPSVYSSEIGQCEMHKLGQAVKGTNLHDA